MERLNLDCCKGSTALLFLGGLSTGIALTVLFAPRSGADTRRLLGRKAEEAQNFVKGHAGEVEERAKVAVGAIARH